MIAAFLQKSALVLLIYQTLAEGKDLLHLFRPKPDDPQPLNDFLTSVQKHKHDFAVIRDYAKKNKKNDQNLLDVHRLFLENNDDDYDEFSVIAQKRKRSLIENLDLVPQNSIYPYMYEKKHNIAKHTLENIDQNNDQHPEIQRGFVNEDDVQGRNSKHIHSPIRLRRELEPSYLKSHVELHSRGRAGEIKREGQKYPMNMHHQTSNEQSRKTKKRDIEIDIKSDGKLLKKFKENGHNPKSIVLNIQEGKQPEASEENPPENRISNNKPNQLTIEEPMERYENKLKVSRNQPDSINRNLGVPMQGIPTKSEHIISDKNTRKDSVYSKPSERKLSHNSQKNNNHNSNLRENHDSREIKNYIKLNPVKGIDMADNNLYGGGNSARKQVENILGDKKDKKFQFEKVKGFILDDNTSNKQNDNEPPQEVMNFAENNFNNKVQSKRDLVKNGLLEDGSEQFHIPQYIPFNIDSTIFDYDSLDATESPDSRFVNNPINLNVRSDNQADLAEGQSFKVIEHVTKEVTIFHENPEPTRENPMPNSQEGGGLDLNLEHHEQEHHENHEVEGTTEANVDAHKDHGDVTVTHNGQGEIEYHIPVNEDLNSNQNNPDSGCIEQEQGQQHHENHNEIENSDDNSDDVEEVEVIEVKPDTEENKAHDSDEEMITHETTDSTSDSSEERKKKSAHVDKIYKNKKTFLVHHKNAYSFPHKFKSLLEEPYHYKYLNLGQNDKIEKNENKDGSKKISENNLQENNKAIKQADKDESFRDRKHLNLPKWKRKRVRQHQKKRIFIHERPPKHSRSNSKILENYDTIEKSNSGEREISRFEAVPDKEDFIPAYHSRNLKFIDAVESNVDPYIGGFENENKHKSAYSYQNSRKKLKSEGDYADEEDPVTETKKDKCTMIKRIENPFGISPEVETEENDDSYNYPEIKSFNKNTRLRNDKQNNKDSVVRAAGQHSKKANHENKEPEFLINKERIPANIDKSRQKVKSQLGIEQSLEDIQADQVASVHRGHSKSKKSKKIISKPKQIHNSNEGTQNLAKQTLTNEQREDLFLKYNPDFQRWPRFVRENERYREEMRRRSLQSQQTGYVNENLVQIPKNSYFVPPEASENNQKHFAKRNNNDNNNKLKQNVDNKEPVEKVRESSTKLNKREEATDETTAPQATETISEETKTEPDEPATVKDNAETVRQRKDYIEDLEAKLTEHSMTVADAGEADSSNQHGETTTLMLGAQITLPKELLGESGGSSGGGSGGEPPANLGVDAGSGDNSAGINSELLGNSNSNNSIFPISVPQSIDPNCQNTSSGGSNSLINDLSSNKNSFTSNGGNETNENKTVQSTTISFPEGGNDEEVSCNSHPEAHVTVCEDTNGNHSQVPMTTMLALVNETNNLYKANISKEQFLDLNDILRGELPKAIVMEVWGDARGSVRKGLRAGHLNMNLELSKSSDTAAESRLILQEITSLMTRLQHATSCQELPKSLKNYLSQLTRNPKDDVLAKLREMNDVDYDDHQGLYVFHSSTNDNLSSKVAILKDLLNKYNNLPADCKERAEPVKEYIENHLGMLTNMLVNSKSSNIPNSQKHKKSLKESQPIEIKTNKEILKEEKDSFDSKHPEDLIVERKRSDEDIKDELIKKQLEEVGLGDTPNFSPNFDLDELIESRKTGIDIEETKDAIQDASGGKAKRNRGALRRDKTPNRAAENKHVGIKRQVDSSTSSQYGKLAEAMRRLRQKRQSAERLSQFYGKPSKEDAEDNARDNAGFESPLVLNF